jgi:hypothetical protein
MDGIRPNADRLDAYRRAGYVIPRPVEGVWHAWLPIGDNGGGAEFHGRNEDELLAKLDQVEAGDFSS